MTHQSPSQRPQPRHRSRARARARVAQPHSSAPATWLTWATLALLALTTGCASAEKRLEQGQELEAAGRFEAAVGRYVEALEKDSGIPGGRERLQTVGDSAVARRLNNVRALRGRGDYAGAADQYRGADGLVARARTVGVYLALPEDYRQARRETFDNAFDGLMARGRRSAERGQWEPAVGDFRTARERFEPSMDQRAASLEAEAEALLGWSDQALGRITRHGYGEQTSRSIGGRLEHPVRLQVAVPLAQPVVVVGARPVPLGKRVREERHAQGAPGAGFLCPGRGSMAGRERDIRQHDVHPLSAVNGWIVRGVAGARS